MKKPLFAVLFASFIVATAFAGPHDKPGFVTFEEDGRLWVFKEGSDQLKEFKEHGEPAKQVSEIGAGPNGMTVKSADETTLKEYLNLLKS